MNSVPQIGLPPIAVVVTAPIDGGRRVASCRLGAASAPATVARDSLADGGNAYAEHEMIAAAIERDIAGDMPDMARRESQGWCNQSALMDTHTYQEPRSPLTPPSPPKRG